MRMPGIIGAIVVTLGLGAAAFSLWRPEQVRGIVASMTTVAQPVIKLVSRPKPDPDLVEASGRLEALEIDLAAKYGGRVLSVVPREGDAVEKGSVVVRLDRTEIEAMAQRADAELLRAHEGLAQAEATITQRRSDVALADAELRRATSLRDREYLSGALFDQKKANHDSAEAALRAAIASQRAASAGVRVAETERDRMKIQTGEYDISSPRNGRVLYRLAEPGEVAVAGQRLLTLIDLDDISLTVFLPMMEAGRVAVGQDAGIILDAFPDQALPARVEFISPRAQFTPKTVETKEERTKFVFRLKLRVNDSLGLPLNPGLPATARLRLKRASAQPAAAGLRP
jgi:HlyD family secretion protein